MNNPLNYTCIDFSSYAGPDDFWVLSINLCSSIVEVVTLVQKMTIILDDEERHFVEKRLSECQIENWADKYERPILDGFRWSLSLSNGDTEVKNISGVNDYPPDNHWRPFIALILRLHDRTIKEGETEVFPSFNTPYGTDKGK